METRPLVRADLITGIVLLVFGLAVLAEAWGMPRLEERRINPWTVPGLVPGMLGFVIASLGSVLALRSLAAGAFRAGAPRSAEEISEAHSSLGRLVLCGVFCLVYAIVLVGRLPFWLATGLFVFAFIASFEWKADDPRAARLKKLAAALVIAAGTAVVVPFLFEKMFLVRLP
jgi:hypothetical protein